MKQPSLTLRGNLYYESRFPLYVTRERESFALAYHDHDFIEIQYVAEGTGYHYIGDERLYVEKGDLFIVPVGTSHVYRPASQAAKDELVVYNCLFEAGLADELLRTWPIPQEIGPLLSGEARPYSRYRDTFGEGWAHIEALYLELKQRQPGYQAALYALLTQLLVYLARLELHKASPPPASTRLTPVFAYIEERLAQQPTLTEAARLLPASPSYLQKLLRRATGQSFTEYVQNRRIQRSMQLLRETMLPVKDIAEQAGYRDMKYFHALFRRKTGQSPRQYRSRE